MKRICEYDLLHAHKMNENHTPRKIVGSSFSFNLKLTEVGSHASEMYNIGAIHTLPHSHRIVTCNT